MKKLTQGSVTNAKSTRLGVRELLFQLLVTGTTEGPVVPKTGHGEGETHGASVGDLACFQGWHEEKRHCSVFQVLCHRQSDLGKMSNGHAEFYLPFSFPRHCRLE